MTRRKTTASSLNTAQLAKHKAMVGRKHEQEQLIADAQVIEAEWRAYSLRLNRELGLKAGESVNEDGEVVNE